MSVLRDHDCQLPNPEDHPVNHFIDSGLFIAARRKFRMWCMLSKSHPLSSKYYKSNASCRSAEVSHLYNHYNMIHPFSQFSLYWEFFMFLVLSVNYVYIPVNASIQVVQKAMEMYVITGLLDFLQLVDIIVQLSTGYYDKDRSRVTLKFGKVFRKRLAFCILDLLSCMQLFLFIGETYEIVEPSSGIYSLRILNRLKILRLGRCLYAIDLFRQQMRYSSYMFKGIKVVLTFIVVIFWAFSIHFFAEHHINTYNSSRGHEVLIDKSLFHWFHDATMVLLLVNLATRSYTMVVEYSNATFFMCFGFCLQLYLYAQVLQVWNKFASAENKHLTLYKQFQEYMTYKELPLSLQHKIFTYFNFRFHRNFFNQSEITKMVSPLLKQEMLLHVVKHHVRKVDLFTSLPDAVLMTIVTHLKTQTYLPGDVIVDAGEMGSTMYFINHGTVAVYNLDGLEICHLEDGDHFGEIALVLNETRVTSVVAVTASELLTLKKTDFLAAIGNFPQIRDELIDMATHKLQVSPSLTLRSLYGSVESL